MNGKNLPTVVRTSAGSERNKPPFIFGNVLVTISLGTDFVETRKVFVN